MSFSSKVKDEISATETTKKNELMFELYAMLIFGGKIQDETLSVSYENKNVMQKLCFLLSTVFKKQNFHYDTSHSKHIHKNMYTVTASFTLDFKKFYYDFWTMNKSRMCLNTNISFLRGAFASCGSITDPEADYHLEFNTSSKKLCNILLSVLNSFESLNLNPKTIVRRGEHVVYLKDNEKITDFLVLIGAKSSAMQLMQIKMIKEVRNNINRTTNFETANLSKTTNSSAEQINAIKKIKASKKFSSLPESLTETAKLRINNPYVSLSELAKLYKLPISKSGVNHRLKKLIKIASEL